MNEEQKLVKLDVLRSAVSQLAAEHPDRVYVRREGTVAACSYHPDDRNPDGCIVGAAIRRIEVELPYHVEGPARHVIIEHVLRMPLGLLSERVENKFGWFTLVQREQDAGTSWGDAVQLADESHPRELTDAAV